MLSSSENQSLTHPYTEVIISACDTVNIRRYQYIMYIVVPIAD